MRAFTLQGTDTGFYWTTVLHHPARAALSNHCTAIVHSWHATQVSFYAQELGFQPISLFNSLMPWYGSKWIAAFLWSSREHRKAKLLVGYLPMLFFSVISIQIIQDNAKLQVFLASSHVQPCAMGRWHGDPWSKTHKTRRQGSGVPPCTVNCNSEWFCAAWTARGLGVSRME